jgi:type II secretory pathway component PulF
MLYKAGVPITKCAQTAPTVTGNLIVAEKFKGGALSAQSGNMVFEGFSRVLPPELLGLWEIAEQSGQLDDSVERLGNTFGDNAEFLFRQFAQWFSRLVYLMVSGYIAMQIFRIASTMPIG